MEATAQPNSRFMTALYDLVGDHATRKTPFGEVAHQAQLTDVEAHGAFAELKGQGFVKSNRDGCVTLTDNGRKSLHARSK